MQGARGAGGWLYLRPALEVVDLPPSVREELHDGVDGSTPSSHHVGSNHDPCRSMDRQGGFAGGCDSRRSAEILRIKEAAQKKHPSNRCCRGHRYYTTRYLTHGTLRDEHSVQEVSSDLHCSCRQGGGGPRDSVCEFLGAQPRDRLRWVF